MAWKRDDRGVTELLNGGPCKAVLDDASGAVADNAATIVHHFTGRAAKSYKVNPAQSGPDGATSQAYTDDPVGHIIEWGSEDTAPQAPIRRGARAAGLKLKETSK